MTINDTINLINKIIARSECSNIPNEHWHLRALAEHMIAELREDLAELPHRRESDDLAVAQLEQRLEGNF